MVHAPDAEKVFIANGFGSERLPVMHNDFVIIGPVDDPADVLSASGIPHVMKKIADGSTGFISRGDDSGTHKKGVITVGRQRVSSPRAAGISPSARVWGQSSRLPMTGRPIPCLTGEPTWLSEGKIGLEVLYAGDEALFNPYHVILLDRERHPHIKYKLARKYADFIRSAEGQKIIADFSIGDEQLFYPDVIR